MLDRSQLWCRKFGRLGWCLPLVAVVVFLVSPLVAQETAEPESKGQFLKKVYEDDQGSHRYQVFLPADYDKQKQYPTILYLHGSDECGRDGEKQVQVGLGPLARSRAADFPFIVVFPQCETTRDHRYLLRWQSGSPDATRALKILEQVERDYSVDRGREIVTGWSMGGYGAWSLAMADPTRWAAVVPVSGGGDVTRVAALKGVPIWVIHGPKDRIVYPERSREMVAALKKAGGTVRYDEPKSEAHGVWQRAYDSEALETWLKNPRRPIPGADVELVARGTPLPADLSPFVPVAHVGGAAYLRVGGDVLDAIAAALPTAVPKDLLKGTVEPLSIQDIDGGTQKKRKKEYYEATLEDISYKGEIHAAGLSTRDDGTVRVRMELKNITVDFPRTQIDKVELDARRIKGGGREYFEKSRKQKFVASGSQILVARQKPVVLDFMLKPSVVDRQLSLGLISTSFKIPPDQYEVIGPAVIEATGLFQESKRKKVYEKIVNSLLEQRGLVEEKIRGAVPTLIAGMEQQLTVADSSELFRNLWPLPVFQPRVKLWPEALVVEKSGLSVAIGMTVAAADPSTAPDTPRELTLVKDLVEKIPHSQSLQIGFAPRLLDPLTRMLIDGGMARIDVRDAPEPLVRQLGDRGELSKVIPAIATMPAATELRTELALTQPISISPTGESASAVRSPMGFRFKIPGAQLIVSTRAGSDWKPLAVFDLALEHAATLQLLNRKQGGGQPLKISFPSEPKITMKGRWAPAAQIGDKTLQADVFQKQFGQAWRAFANKALESTVMISDFEFGDITLPLKDIGWNSPLMSIEFGLSPKPRAALQGPGKGQFESPVIGRPAREAGTDGSPVRPSKRESARPRR